MRETTTTDDGAGTARRGDGGVPWGGVSLVGDELGAVLGRVKDARRSARRWQEPAVVRDLTVAPDP